ncbi:MAG: hypothetical protein FJZ56_07035 [Chlamydiae bacterium]|nr:hypothetical protein [Chlamydiota bacterium]
MSAIDIQDEGKVIKIYFKPQIDRTLFYSLMKNSPIVGCRGNQSFIEALSLQKPLFYDPVKHNLSFLYDLIAVIRDRMPELFPLFSLFVESLDEDIEAWQILGKKIAFSMRDTFSLFELLKREYCFNPVLEAVIKRAAFIKKHKEHLAWETEAIQKILGNTLSFPSFYSALKGKLDGRADSNS